MNDIHAPHKLWTAIVVSAADFPEDNRMGALQEWAAREGYPPVSEFFPLIGEGAGKLQVIFRRSGYPAR